MSLGSLPDEKGVTCSAFLGRAISYFAAHGITGIQRLMTDNAWAYRYAFTNNDQRCAALAPWLEHYNTERRHSVLGGKPPISRLLPT